MILATSDSFPSAGGGSERRRCAGSPRSAGERRSVSLPLVVLAVVLTAASCGSSDDGDSSPSTPPRSVAQAQGVVFTHEVIDADPPSGSECCLDVVTAGDVDGDGDADVIVGAEDADGLSWYQNPGAPPSVTEWARFIIGAGDFTTDGLAGDLDRDGDLDVAVSSIDRNVVEWWEQIGDPSTTDGWARHEIGPDFAHDLLLADVDSDGKVDVGAFHSAAGRVAWYEQPDDPTGAWTGHEVDSIDGEGIAAGDLDGDGDTDLVAGPAVYSNDDGDGTAWTRQPLGEDWPEQIRARVADIDEDDVLDIVLVADETEGRLSWLRGPDWAETTIDDDAGYSHSLEVGDVDLDGHLDLLVGVMHGAENPEVRVLFGDGGGDWGETVLSTSGTHNARLVDLDGNGLLDVVGKNFDGPKQVESWWAHPVEAAVEAARPAADAAVPTPLYGFTSVVVDDGREGFNDSTAFFGLTFADLDGDGDDDIASGSYVYLNPGSDLTAPWERIELTEQVGAVVDVMLATDVDGDDQADLIATALPDVWWLEAEEGAATWTGTIVAEVPATSRPNGQGHRLGDLTGDGHR